MTHSLQSIQYSYGTLKILNQLKLPHVFEYEDCSNSLICFNAIQEMKVRGAPAIAITAVLSLACELVNSKKKLTLLETKNYIIEKLNYLCESRPTAVNLFTVAEEFKILIEKKFKELNFLQAGSYSLIQEYEKYAKNLLEKDIENNKKIGTNGAALFNNSVQILTHCNTGSLATAGYGTALGVIRSLHHINKIKHVYTTETRPYNQGSRLTAFELAHDKIPATLIADSMAAFLMKQNNIDAVIVGADRIVSNGDTANKIGTYQLAVAAKYHEIPFYVAAPTSTFDCSKKSGGEINIEFRPSYELTHINDQAIAAKGIEAWNPSFDVTSSDLITAFITENGVIYKNQQGKFDISKFILSHSIGKNNASP